MEVLARNPETLVFYESCHRIVTTLECIASVFGGERQLCVARELTKTFETWLVGTVNEVVSQVNEDVNQQKGEFVLVLAGNPTEVRADDEQIGRYMQRLLEDVPIKTAAALTADLLGAKKKHCYQIGLELQGRG